MRRVTQAGGERVESEQIAGPNQPYTPWFLNRRFSKFERTLAFPQSRDAEVWRRWRRKLRRALRKTLCLGQLGEVPIPRPKVLERVSCEGYRREKLAYETLPGNWVSAYLLVPEGGGRR